MPDLGPQKAAVVCGSMSESVLAEELEPDIDCADLKSWLQGITLSSWVCNERYTGYAWDISWFLRWSGFVKKHSTP